MPIPEEDIQSILRSFEEALRGEAVVIECERGTVGTPNVKTGNWEFEATKGQRITLILNGGPTHTRRDVNPFTGAITREYDAPRPGGPYRQS